MFFKNKISTMEFSITELKLQLEIYYAVTVIRSCVTKEQLINAFNFTSIIKGRYKNKFPGIDTKIKQLHKAVQNQMSALNLHSNEGIRRIVNDFT
jgi:hypothetical protein